MNDRDTCCHRVGVGNPVLDSPILMRHVRRNPWMVLGAAVVAVDAYAIVYKSPTLTSAFRTALRHPIRRWFVLAAWLTLSSHLVFGKP